MEHQEITSKIIGCAYKVHNSLGFGFLESVYHKAMLIELANADIKAESEKPLFVIYNGQSVGEFQADLVVENSIIVEFKSIERLAKAHEVQLVNYLHALKIDIGLLINFGPERVEVKRKFRKLSLTRTMPATH
ncbi:GxxExxY protein [Desulfonatronum parangueonense]